MTTQIPTTAPVKPADSDEQEFQQFKSARASTRMVTPLGLRISFTNFQFLTQNQDAIDYLDAEIAGGLQGITKGSILTTSDLDPMEALRKTVRAELLAEMKEEAANAVEGVSKDMGSTEAKPAIKVASTKAVAS